MKIPSISIVTIVYNGMPFLKECVESVLKQEQIDWELLISDDGSGDGSRDYLDSLNDPRIKVFKQTKNLGIFDNLNFLFSKALAPISQILCQDDYFVAPDSLSVILRYWQTADPRIGFVRFNHDFDNSNALVKFQENILSKVVTSDRAPLLFYLFGNIPGNLSNVSLRTGLVKEYNGFRQTLPFAGDFEFWSRLASHVSMGIESAKVVYVRRHPGVASNYLNKRGELLAQMESIISPLYERLSTAHRGHERLLKIYGTLNYDILPRDTAVRRLLKGQSVYLKQLNNVSGKAAFTLSPLSRWLLFAVTAGGRVGRVWLAKRVLNACAASNNINPNNLKNS